MKRDTFNIFNLNEFKKWMESSTQDKSGESLIGVSVGSKVSFKKLKNVSEALDNERAIIEFHKNGGTILEAEEDIVTIKTTKGCLKLDKSYIVFN
jgi:hypothetical protein